jgi:Clp amino terminal domain, pathogenicity island component
MNGYNFTERMRKVLARAREEAFNRQHMYVGTEHLLLGIIGENEGVAIGLLRTLRIDTDLLRQRVDEVVKNGPPMLAGGPDRPYTSRAKKVVELAMTEARELNYSYVGTEHLLLGLIREEKGSAAQVLVEAGASLDSVRAEMLRTYGERKTHAPAAARTPAFRSPQRSRVARLAALAVAASSMVIGAVQLVAPDVILRGVGGDPTPAAMHFLSMSGLTGALFGGMLWQTLRARTLLSIPFEWSTLQKFCSAAAFGLAVARGLMSPYALTAGLAELTSGIVLLWYWSLVRQFRQST